MRALRAWTGERSIKRSRLSSLEWEDTVSLADLQPPKEKYNELVAFVRENQSISDKKEKERNELVHLSLNCFSLDNPVRQLALRVINSRSFDRFILCAIAASSVMMGMGSAVVSEIPSSSIEASTN